MLAFRVLSRRSIFDTLVCELPPMNDRKMQFLRDGTKIVLPVFCEELQGSHRSGHLGRMIKVTKDMVNFIIS